MTRRLTTAAVSRLMLTTMAPRPKMPQPTVEEIAREIRADIERRLRR